MYYNADVFFIFDMGNVMRKHVYLAMALFLGLSVPCAYAQYGEGSRLPGDKRSAPQDESANRRMPLGLHGRKNAREHRQRLSPEERRELRRDIRDAGRELYQTRPQL